MKTFETFGGLLHKFAILVVQQVMGHGEGPYSKQLAK